MSLFDQIQSETMAEMREGFLATVEAARRRHGADPQFDLLILSTIGSAIQQLGLIDAPATRALAQCLLDGGPGR